MIDRDKYLQSESLFRDVHNLTDTDLENHIKDLIAMAYDYEIVFGRNSTTPLFLLMLAAIEKTIAPHQPYPEPPSTSPQPAPVSAHSASYSPYGCSGRKASIGYVRCSRNYLIMAALQVRRLGQSAPLLDRMLVARPRQLLHLDASHAPTLAGLQAAHW